MSTRKHKQIKETSPFTKLWNLANMLLHHQAKQAIHPLHKTNIFSKLIKPCISLKNINSPMFTMNPHGLYNKQGGGNPPRATRRPLAKNKYLKLSLRPYKVQGTKYLSKISFRTKIEKKNHF